MDLAQLLSRKAVEGLDIQKGIALYDGRISVYMEVLIAFYEQGPRQIAAMKEALVAKDFARYGIEAHALKSAARGVGAIALGELAAESDAAGKHGDTDSVQKKSGRLLRRYKALIDALTAIGLTDNETTAERKGSIDIQVLRRRLEDAAGRAASYDLGTASEILRDLLHYDLDATVASEIRVALNLSTQFQYDETEDAIRSILEKLT